jgi:chromosome segregation ATPase
MNNKKLIALVISGLMLMPTIAYAKGNSHDSSNKGGQIVNSETKNSSDNKNIGSPENKKVEEKKNEAKRLEKKSQIEAFKTQMRAKHEIMKQIRQDTKTVKKQVETKTSQLKAIISDIQAGKRTLTEDMLTALLAKSENLKIDINELKATSNINKHLSEAQEKVNKRDFNNALSALDNVIAKLQSRLDALKKLNIDLDAALAIANGATVPTPVAGTTPPENLTTTAGRNSGTAISNPTTTVDSTTSATPTIN